MLTLDEEHDKAAEKRHSTEAFDATQQETVRVAVDTSHHTNTNSNIPLSRRKRRKTRRRAMPITKISKHDNTNKRRDAVVESTDITTTSIHTLKEPTTAHSIITDKHSNNANTGHYDTDEENKRSLTHMTTTATIPSANDPTIPSSICTDIFFEGDSFRQNTKDDQHSVGVEIYRQKPEQIDDPSSTTISPSSRPLTQSTGSPPTMTETIISGTSTSASVKKEKDSTWIPSSTTTTDDMAKKAGSALTGNNEITASVISIDSKLFPKVSHSPPQQLLDCLGMTGDLDTSKNVDKKSEVLLSPAAYPPEPAPAYIPQSSTVYTLESIAVYSPESSTVCPPELTPITNIEDSIVKTSKAPEKCLRNEMKEKSDSTTNDQGPVSTYSSDNVLSFQHEGETCYCIGLEKNQKLVFIGYALIGALYGSIEMCGATISANTDLPSRLKHFFQMSQYVSFFPTFSSRASGLTVIQSTCYEKVATRAPSVTMNSTFDNLTELLGAFDERWERFESIVVVKSLDWCGVDQLEQVMPSLKNQFRLGTKHAYVINDGPFYDDITGFQPIINVTPEVKALQNQSSWQISVDRIISYEQEHVAPSISVICGNINVNKSAFARYTINRLLKIHQRVAYLETDVGQTEFTPAGLVSLHVVETPVLGPSFTHPHLKCRQSFFIGTTSARMDPTYYQQCIKQLLSKYRQESEEWTKIAHQDQDGSFLLPLVVNTHGWTSGLGYDILLSLMENAKPTHVFGLMSLAASGYGLEKNFPDDFAHKVMMFLPPHLPVKQQLMFLTAPTPTSELLEHHQHRQLMFLSYIYHNPQVFCRRRQDTTTCSSSWWQVAPPLIHRTPWTADWHEQIHGVWVLYDDVPLSQLLYVLKGAIVALIGEVRPLDDDGDDNELTVIEEKNIDQQQQRQKQPYDDDRPLHEEIMKKNETKKGWRLPNYHPAHTSARPDPSNTTCYGIGVIREIVPERHQFHVFTPLPTDRLGQVTRIVKGDLELPVFCMLDQSLTGTYQDCGEY